MEMKELNPKEDRVSVKDLVKKAFFVCGIASFLSIPFLVDPNFSWATPQFVQVISREIPETGRITMNLRLPVNGNYPLWLQAGVLNQCLESEREFSGFMLGLDDYGNPFLDKTDRLPSFNFTCQRP